MYRFPLAAILLVQACGADPEAANYPFQDDGVQALPGDELPPPLLTLTGPAYIVPGYPATFTTTGPLNPGEVVYLALGVGGVGAGPCPAALGAQCLGIRPTIRVLGTSTESGGAATLVVNVPATAPVGAMPGFQSASVRGPGGSTSALSNAIELEVRAAVLGCTDASANNFDPSATVDDGSCTYSGSSISVEMDSGTVPVPNTCTVGDYDCQARTVCEYVSGGSCTYQDYDCWSGGGGSYFPTGTPGGSDFNFSRLATQSGYGNVCGCDVALFESYGLRSYLTYCGIGQWNRDPM
jgi:hypothetical protein